MENKTEMVKKEKKKEAVTFNFKNTELNKASARITALKGSISKNMGEIAKILGRVKRDKLYEDDGFKSVSEYAENALSLGKATAYQLASVGERFLLNDSVTAKTVSAMLPPSNLAELVTLSDEEIQDAVNKKNITPNSTQTELRTLAKAVKGKRKGDDVKVLPQFIVDVKILHNNTVSDIHADKMTLPEAILEIGKKIDFKGFTEKQFINEGKKDGEYHAGVRIYFKESTGDIVKLKYARIEKPKAEEPKKPAFTKEQLLAMLAELGE